MWICVAAERNERRIDKDGDSRRPENKKMKSGRNDVGDKDYVFVG